MRPALRAVALFASVYLVALVLEAPAALLLGRLAPAWQRYLSDPVGTPWAGQVRLMAPGAPLTVHWRLSPWSLLGGCAAGTLTVQGGGALDAAGDTTGDAQVALCGERLEASALRLRLPVATLAGFDAAGVVAQAAPSGHLTIELSELQLGPHRLRAHGRVRWYDAALHWPRRLQLGTVSADIEPAARGLRAVIVNVDGELGLEVELNVDVDGNYQLRGWLDAGDDDELASALATFGPPAADGRHGLRYAGRLTP